MNKTQAQPTLSDSSPSRKPLLAAWRTARVGLLLWVIFSLFLGLVQFSTPDLPDNDGFYHIKMAYLMRTEGFKPPFPWLPLTILKPDEFSDHHFLYHAALIPFTFGDLRLGAKWSAVFFASLAFLSVWNLLKNARVPIAPLWALGLLAVSEAFIYRMSITRAQSLSLAVLMLGFDWLLRKKYLPLGALAFAYVWMYDAFPLLPALALVATLTEWLTDKRLDLRPLMYIAAGTALGLVVNPYFPQNIIFVARHILPKLSDATAISVGNEWFPYDTAQLLRNSPLALAAFLSGALALGLSGRRMDARNLSSFILASLFGWMLFQSRRFIEYFPPFALVFAAFTWAPVLERFYASHGIDPVKDDFRSRMKGKLMNHLPALTLAIVVLAGGWITFKDTRISLRTSKSYLSFAGASAWLTGNTLVGERVFQTDWDDFPRLFFYNTHNTYLVGLDPTYLSLQNPTLYDQWVAITRGKVAFPSESIVGDFGAHFVLTDLQHGDFLDQAALDPLLVEVYRNYDVVVFKVDTLAE
jgi:hypothetical protein